MERSGDRSGSRLPGKMRYHGAMPRECQRGIALISVLWITALLAVIAASFASSARTEGQLALNMVENAKAEALADGAVHRAVLGLLDPDAERAWRTDGTPYQLDYGEGRVTIRVYDEDAKVDLNAAPPELLVGLLGLVGLEPEQAETLADRIVDYRDEDDEPEPNGAEDADYEAAGRRYGAIDRPFLTEAELLGVLGMSEALYRRLRPLVTVHSGAEGIDPSRASPDILLSIPGMTPELVEAIKAAGPDGDPFEVIDDDTLFDLEIYFIPSREIMFRVQAEARTAGGGCVRARRRDRADPRSRAPVHRERLAARGAVVGARRLRPCGPARPHAR